VKTIDAHRIAVTVRDGSRLVVRPVRPDDRALLLAGFERLGPESRYKRFLAPMPELTDDGGLPHVGGPPRPRGAGRAIDPATGEGVGVARFVRLAERPDTAEAAVTVIDDWQGRGVGTILLGLLAERARAEGIVRFTALLLAENRDMLELLEALGSVRVIDRELGTVEIEAELPAKGAGAELRQALRASASRSARNASASS